MPTLLHPIRKTPAPWREQKKIKLQRRPQKRKKNSKKRKPAKKKFSLLITPKHIRVINVSKNSSRVRKKFSTSYVTFSTKEMIYVVMLIVKKIFEEAHKTKNFSIYNQLFCGYLRQPIKLSWKNEKEVTISGFCVLKQKSCKRTGEITKNDFKIMHAPECIIYKNYF